MSDFAKRKEVAAFLASGWHRRSCLCAVAAVRRGPDPSLRSGIYDYWHTSPNFFLMRCGILLMILFLVYAWCRWGLAGKGFSPIIQLGQTSSTGLLGAHRIRVRATLDPAEGKMQHRRGNRGPSDHFRCDAGSLDRTNALEEKDR